MSRERNLSSVKNIIVHCAATPDGDDRFNAQDIDNWHRERGFKRAKRIQESCNPVFDSIGYHFVIDIDGSIEGGRALNETGAHCRGYNTSSIGICMIGSQCFTQAQWDCLTMTVNTLNLMFGRRLDIKGHRDMPNVRKTCPGFDVATWIENEFKPDPKHLIKEG